MPPTTEPIEPAALIPAPAEVTAQERGDDFLIAFGSAVKAAADGTVSGYLVRFTGPEDPDIDGEFFDAATDFDVETWPAATRCYYNHGLDKTLGKTKLPRGTMKRDEVGIWVETQLDLADRYERAIHSLAKAGKLAWSSGSLTHLADYEAVGAVKRIKYWPLGLDASMLPTPAEPRNRVVALKSWREEAPDLETLLPMPSPFAAEGSGAAEWPRVRLATGKSLAEDAAHLIGAAQEVAEQAGAILPIYQQFVGSARKEGRMISTARRERLQGVHDSFTDMLRQLGQMQNLIADLLTETDPDETNRLWAQVQATLNRTAGAGAS